MGLFDFLSNKTDVQYISEGNDLLSRGQYSRAVTLFDKAIAINPNTVEVWNQRGNALLNSVSVQNHSPLMTKRLRLIQMIQMHGVIEGSL